MSKLSNVAQSLYEGRISFDFVGRKMLWYLMSGVIVLVAAYGLLVPKLNLGIEFEGGVEYRVAVGTGNADESAVNAVRDAVVATDLDNASSPIVNTSNDDLIRLQTLPLSTSESDEVSLAIQEALAVPASDVSSNSIGPSWGEQIAKRALTGLAVFLFLVVLLIWAYFREWKASVAALVALAHDLIITIGVYALSGFEVTPATVTGVLTILGFSLYDTVVVFDKVRENTDAKTMVRRHQTYGEAANLAVNQTLVRSINTSIVALLPVGALLYVGAFQLGSGALKDLALALFVGMAAGTYSSIFIATPLLVQLKELEPGVRAGDTRAKKHRSRRDVDPFARVPAFAEDMPMHDRPDNLGDEMEGVEADEVPDRPLGRPSGSEGGNRAVSAGAPTRVTAGERPPSGRPVSESTSAGRPQPTRKPRSRRSKP